MPGGWMYELQVPGHLLETTLYQEGVHRIEQLLEFLLSFFIVSGNNAILPHDSLQSLAFEAT